MTMKKDKQHTRTPSDPSPQTARTKSPGRWIIYERIKKVVTEADKEHLDDALDDFGFSECGRCTDLIIQYEKGEEEGDEAGFDYGYQEGYADGVRDGKDSLLITARAEETKATSTLNDIGRILNELKDDKIKKMSDRERNISFKFFVDYAKKFTV